MKKVIRSLVVGLAALMMVAGTSFAGTGNGVHWGTDWNPGNHYGWGDNGGDGEDFGSDSGAFGTFDIEANSFGYGISMDGKRIPNGAAGGIGGAIGFSGAEADGFVFDGTVGGNVSTIGGGFSETDAYRFTPAGHDRAIGVGSWTTTYGRTGAHADINVDPDSGIGGADASISGFTAMGSLNGSYVSGSPRFGWESDGYSAGVAGQGAFGGFEGGAVVGSGPDVDFPGFYIWGYEILPPCNIDSNADATVGADITMNGYSLTESSRWIDTDEFGYRTEGMATFVDAETHVTSIGYATQNSNDLAFSHSGVQGGYVAMGGAATQTVQSNNNGNASASAVGFYAGVGSLNTTFDGKSVGYSSTSMISHPTANGTVSTASAGMQVTAQSGNTLQ